LAAIWDQGLTKWLTCKIIFLLYGNTYNLHQIKPTNIKDQSLLIWWLFSFFLETTNMFKPKLNMNGHWMSPQNLCIRKLKWLSL